MDTADKIDLINAPPTEEIITKSDLKAIIERGIPLKHYIGFEISGFLHLGSGIVTMSKVADLQKAGVGCSIFLADLHTWINDKLGGDLDAIKKTAVGYYKEGFNQCLKVMGGKPSKVKYVLGSELYEKHKSEFLKAMIDVSKNTTLARIKRSITIMGRKEKEKINFAMLLYPPMQVADIFIQGINLAHSGTDQRKAHVVARDVATKLKIHPLTFEKTIKEKTYKEKYKPVALHTHLLAGLGKPPVWPIKKRKLKEVLSEMKMSKSIPKTCVFIHDSPKQIKTKMMNAFCPPKETKFNPVLDWAKHIIFKANRELEIDRPKKYGGKIHFYSYEDLEKVYSDGALHPLDLKAGVAKELTELLAPIRKHFNKPRIRKMKEDLEKLKKTR
ncbi:tyrosine--tRNA ligase [Candidatus Woesearchaeota archaeon]|nr:tyrosine--tRNA ligase [Candidatus Woesearchaeota archaeon]